MGLFTGSKGKYSQQSTLGQEQQPLYQQLQAANQGQGAGGSFGTAADYYRDLLSDNPQDLQAYAAPEMRRFNEEIIPGLSEQFAGMGSGGLSSSGFRNAAVSAGTDLSERLGSMRAQLRQQGAQGLTNLGQQGLQQYNENIYTPGQPGLLDYAAQAGGAALTGLAGGAAQGWMNSSKGKSSPYGGRAGQSSASMI